MTDTGRCPGCNFEFPVHNGFLPPHSILRTITGPNVTTTEVWRGFSKHDRVGTVTHCPGSGRHPQ
jgi:hypothetical protein